MKVKVLVALLSGLDPESDVFLADTKIESVIPLLESAISYPLQLEHGKKPRNAVVIGNVKMERL